MVINIRMSFEQGEEGVYDMMSIIMKELKNTMALTGEQNYRQICPQNHQNAVRALSYICGLKPLTFIILLGLPPVLG